MELYDKLLTGMFGSLAGGVAAGLLTAAPLYLGVAVGTVPAAVFMYLGMFRHAPVHV